MNDSKSRDIFYGVVAIATLIVALIGATLAYFSITANSAEGAVSAKAATVSIVYEDGQARIAPAENLIPVTFDVLQTLYRRNLNDINEQFNTEVTEGEEPRKNRCKDGKAGSNYEVCSTFRFTVSNDVETNIRAMLRTEFNGFKYLDYAVRNADCTADESHEDECWLNVSYNDSGNPVKHAHLDTCDNTTENKCYTEDTTRSYTPLATRSIFGLKSASDPTFNDISISATSHSYDVVLFINDDDTNQNEDQGKTYSGNIYVETTSGSEKITGQLN